MSDSPATDRRRFLERFAGLGLSFTLFPGALWAQLQQSRTSPVTKVMLRDADANRIRGLLMREMARILSEVDVYVVPFDYADYTPNPVATMPLPSRTCPASRA